MKEFNKNDCRVSLSINGTFYLVLFGVLYKYYFIQHLKLFLQSVVAVVLSCITLINNI